MSLMCPESMCLGDVYMPMYLMPMYLCDVYMPTYLCDVCVYMRVYVSTCLCVYVSTCCLWRSHGACCMTSLRAATRILGGYGCEASS